MTSPPFLVSSQLETGGFSGVGLTCFVQARSGSEARIAANAVTRCRSHGETRHGFVLSEGGIRAFD